MIKIIVGLGNEGKNYAQTFHNIGRLAAAYFEEQQKSDPSLGLFFRFFSPPGFMNQIGIPIRQFLKNTPFAPASLLIVHDESDLPLGAYKISFGGGSAGHNGVASVIQELGTPDFWRLRIGIRDPQEQVRQKAETFVLNTMSAPQQALLTEVFAQAWNELLTRDFSDESA